MATRYHEMVIQGPRGKVLGFVAGYVRGRGIIDKIIDAEQEGFACEPLRERISELLHPASETLHLLVPEETVALVRQAVTEMDEELHASVRAERVVSGARFAFTVAIYSPEHADRIEAYFKDLPEGTHLSADSKFTRSLHPDDKGIEVYAPVHEFSFIGQGTVEGGIDEVLEVFRFCRDEELIEAHAAELIEETAPH